MCYHMGIAQSKFQRFSNAAQEGIQAFPSAEKMLGKLPNCVSGMCKRRAKDKQQYICGTPSHIVVLQA